MRFTALAVLLVVGLAFGLDPDDGTGALMVGGSSESHMGPWALGRAAGGYS